jgi:class 3 adenylate cyclase
MAYLFDRAPRAIPTGPAAGSEPAAPAVAAPVRRRRRSRPFWTLTGFVLVVALASAMAYYAYEGNRRLELMLSGKLGDSERRLASQVRGYFNPTQQFLEIASVAAYGRDVTEGGWEIARLAELVLPRTPAIVAFIYVDPAGNYVRVVRNEHGTMDTTWGNRSKGQIETTRRDASGQQSTTSSPLDAYDPRTQPWYREAERTGKQVWTDAHLLPPWGKARTATPGVTLAIPQYAKGDSRLRSVMALDLDLASVSSILRDNENIGEGGKALIIDGGGRIIAYPGDGWFPAGPDAKAPLLDQMGDPILAYIYDLWRVAPFDRKIIDVGGGEHVVVAAQRMRRLTDDNWRILSYVPTTESEGALSSDDILHGAIAALILVAGISGWMAWRSVRAERRSAAALARQETAELQVQSVVDLVREASSSDAGGGALQAATEGAARACDAKRVAVWRLTPDGRSLRCEDCFDRTVEGHTSGLELHRDELYDLFAALSAGTPIDAQDAERDPRTAALFASYLSPLEIRRVYIRPLIGEDRLVGMLTVEDPPAGDSAASLAAYCDMLAMLLVMRFAGAAPAVAPSPAARAEAIRRAADASASDGLARRRTRIERTLIRQSGALDALGDRVVDAAAVGVVRLPDWTTLVQQGPSGGEAPTAMDAIVREMHRIIEARGLDYAARLDDQVVLAVLAADAGGASGSALRLAHAMIALRDRLVELEEELGTTLDFGLAMDVGVSMCSTDGGDPPSRHLWGGSVGVARVLAGTTARRGIAVSEPVYELLADAFLFRPRGSFFLPETGNMRTFILVGEA